MYYSLSSQITNQNLVSMRITFSQFNTNDLVTLVQRCIKVSEESDFDVLSNHQLLFKLKSAYNKFGKVYYSNLYSDKNKLLFDANRKRDIPYKAFKSILSGYIHQLSYSYYLEALEIYSIIECFGIELNTQNYYVETIQMKKLIEELEKAENASKIEKLQLTHLVSEMKVAQKAFDFLYNNTESYINYTSKTEYLKNNINTNYFQNSNREILETALYNYFNMVEIMNNLTVWRELYIKLNNELKTINKNHLRNVKNEILSKQYL